MGVPYAEVIGDPIAHSKSPLIHKFWLEKLGIQGDYGLVHVRSGELASYLSSRRTDPDWLGCNVTRPHKRKIVPLLDEAKLFATDAVNCVVPRDGRLIGHNTDTAGVSAAVDDRLDRAHPVCIIGSGGAASAAIAELDLGAVFQFNVIARDQARARALVEPYDHYGKAFSFADAGEAMRGCSALINATPLGMISFEPMPKAVIDGLGGLRRGAVVLDMVYAPLRTDLLCRAKLLGLRTADGLTMLVGQAKDSFHLFFGRQVSAEYDAELRELLTR